MYNYLKYMLKGLAVILGLIVFYLLAVFFLPLIPVNTQSAKINKDSITIFILTNGMHTDVVVPVETEQINWADLIPFSDTTSKQPMKYIAFGWGDKGFYLDTPEWKDLKVSTALKAAFWLGSSAMHTTFYDRMVENEMCKKIEISPEDYKQLIVYIKQSFKLDDKGKVEFIPTDMVYGKNDSFYEANGTYNIFFTCNTWASGALKSANQLAPLWTATQQGIFYHYK